MAIRDISSDEPDFVAGDHAALPSDVRKVSDFPAATPEFGGYAPEETGRSPFQFATLR